MVYLQVFYYKQLAIWALIFNRRDIAIEQWKRIRVLRPNDSSVPASIAHLTAEMGLKREAMQYLEESLAMNSTNALAWYNLGFLHQEHSEQEQALVAFDRAIENNPKMDLAFYGKALALIKLNRIDEAIPMLKRNTELQPMSPYGWYQLAHAYNRLGQSDKVKKTIVKLSGFEPKVAVQLQTELGIDAGVVSPFAGYSK